MPARRLLSLLRERLAPRPASGVPDYPPPVRARHVVWSAISSADDLVPGPTPELLDLALEAARRAREVRLDAVAERAVPAERAWVQQWPGEHYRLLAALVDTLQPRNVVEVGTFTGMGSLSLRERLPAGGRVVTYDIIPWERIPGTLLRAEDFGPSLEQRMGNLADPAYFASQEETLASAELLFVDGPKDGVFEPAFARLLVPLLERTGATVVFDDIRLPVMLQFWRDFPLPKLDMTSFGHWSGTGLARRG